MLIKLLSVATALTLASLAASAAEETYLSKDQLVTMAPHGTRSPLPQGLRRPGGGAGVFNNLAFKYPNGVYWCCAGGTISGPGSSIGASYAQGIPFTPAATKIVRTITVGLTYVSGTDSATVALYSDSSGVPGTELVSAAANNMPADGTCCITTAVKIPPTRLAAGTQYWVVLSAATDAYLAWEAETVDVANNNTTAYNRNNSGWSTYSYVETWSAQVK